MRKIFNSVTAIYEQARVQEQIVRAGTWRERIQAGIVILLGVGAIGTALAAGIEIIEAYDFNSISGVIPSQVEYILLTIGMWQAADYIRELKVKTTSST